MALGLDWPLPGPGRRTTLRSRRCSTGSPPTNYPTEPKHGVILARFGGVDIISPQGKLNDIRLKPTPPRRGSEVVLVDVGFVEDERFAQNHLGAAHFHRSQPPGGQGISACVPLHE